MDEVIAEMKQYCLDNYEKGGSWFVECWGEHEWKEFYEKCIGNDVGAMDELRLFVNYYAEQETNARIESGVEW